MFMSDLWNKSTEDRLHRYVLKYSVFSIQDLLDGLMVIGYGAPFNFALIDTYPKVRYWL